MSAQTSGWTLMHSLISRERQKRPGICMSWGCHPHPALLAEPLSPLWGLEELEYKPLPYELHLELLTLHLSPWIGSFGFSGLVLVAHWTQSPQHSGRGLSLCPQPYFTALHHSESVKVATHLRLPQASHWPKAIPSKFCEHLQHPYYSAFLSC